MEFNKVVSNPMLMGTIQLMKADPSPEHKNMFVNEMMKSQFMSPAIVEPKPEADGEGKLKVAPGSKIQFPMLTAPDGKRFCMAFTDKMEYEKWKEAQKASFFALSLDELAAMVLRKDSQALGFVINPFSENIVVPREMLASLMAAKLAKMKEAQEKKSAQEQKKTQEHAGKPEQV